MNSLQIFLFGPVRVIHAGQPSPVSLTHAVQTLLAYLLIQRHRGYPRELLTDLFWSEHSQEQARRCLNTALWRLRQVLEPEGIPRGTYLLTTSTDKVSFNWKSNYWLDVALFEEQVNQILAKPVQAMNVADAQILKNALQLYIGELVEGVYDDWALRERERLRCLYLNSLAHLLHYHKRQGAFEESLACGQKILDQDPLREEIHREMMRLYCESGQRPLAIRQYERCCQILATELGISPMEETQALYTQVVHSANPGQTSSTPTEEPGSYQQMLHQLRLARQEFDQARAQLERAIQLAEQLTNHQD